MEESSNESNDSLSTSQFSSLRGIVDGLMPSLPNLTEYQNEDHDQFWNIKLSENKCFMHALVLVLTAKLNTAELSDIKLLLTALSTTLGSMLLFATISTTPFSGWEASDQAEALNRLRTSRLVDKRKAFNGLKRLICGLALSFVDDTGKNPFWQAIQYPGPLPDAKKFATNKCDAENPNAFVNKSDIERNDIEFDCIVVGSGAGGSVAADNLSKAGYSVLVIEKGGVPDVQHLEAASFETMYEKSGLLTTVDGNVSVLAASVLGGGPSINWSCCIETPPYVRKEWVEQHGLTDFRIDGDFDESQEYILNRIEAKNDHVIHNGMNKAFILGLESRSISYDVTKQNLRDTATQSAGYGCFGDRSGNKRCALKTFLSDAVNKGAKILTNARVSRILHTNHRATGVEINFKSMTYQLRAKRCVILSAGSLHTPCILKRSGFLNRNIGQHLHLHPVVSIVGTFKNQEINGYLGAPMTVACKEFSSGIKNDGYGPILECPSAHTGLVGASGCSWNSPKDFRESALSLKNMSSIIVLQRDKGEGYIDVDHEGNPRIHYSLDVHDGENMIMGIKEVLKTFYAAGVSSAVLAGIKDIRFEIDAGKLEADNMKELDSIIEDIEQIGIKPHEVGLFSAHQMGTARLSVSPKNGALSEDGELWDCEDLYICDASTFPTASGANPMCTTLTIAHMLSKRLANRLLFEDSKLLDSNEFSKISQILRLRESRRMQHFTAT